MKKLDEKDDYAAIILAAAGLKRMGWESRVSQVGEGCRHVMSQRDTHSNWLHIAVTVRIVGQVYISLMYYGIRM